MGRYPSPDAKGFVGCLEGYDYVGMMGLVAYMNGVSDTDRRSECSRRPRRLGKSTAAVMLAAYHSKGYAGRRQFLRFADKHVPNHKVTISL